MGKTSIALAGLLLLAVGGMAQTIPAPASIGQATNMVSQDVYMSPARMADFWNDIGIPYVLANGGGGTSTTNFNNINVTNTVTAGTYYGNGTGLTNLQGSNVVGAVSNATTAGTATNVLDIYSNYEGMVVCPYTNVSASISNSSRFFGPWKGLDYVQQAINALPNYGGANSNRLAVGGGKILVVGINYTPNTILFTNTGDGIMSFDIEAAAFTAGSLVCATNPCIRVNAGYSASSINFQMKNLIVSSLANQCTNLCEILNGVARLDIEMNWFGPWQGMTNNLDNARGSPFYIGLSTPTTGGGITTNNLVGLYIMATKGDEFIVENNSFIYCAVGIDNVSDHGFFNKNFFSYCGSGALPYDIIIYTAWPTNSLQGLGAAVIIESVGLDVWENSYFYQCGGGYTIYSGVQNFSTQDKFENCSTNLINIFDGATYNYFGYTTVSSYSPSVINYFNSSMTAYNDSPYANGAVNTTFGVFFVSGTLFAPTVQATTVQATTVQATTVNANTISCSNLVGLPVVDTSIVLGSGWGTGCACADTNFNGIFYADGANNYTNLSGNAELVRARGNSYTASNSISASQFSGTSLTNVFLQINSVNAVGIFVYGTTNALFTGNGGGLTNIPSIGITGGMTTNIQLTDTALATITTNTLYFTNGILMKVTSP
jgi:hypothetical protein